MTIGAITVRASLTLANSLKDKRRVILSLKDRLRNKFNVAVAELDYLDEWRQTEIGIVTLANDARVVNSSLSHILNFLRDCPEIVVIEVQQEIY